MNISIAIADTNTEYTQRLTEGLQQYDELTIYVYTSAEKFRKAMDSKRFDVALFDPDICEEHLDFTGVKLPICLYGDETVHAGNYTKLIKTAKYQRISGIYKEIIRNFAEKADSSVEFDYSQNTTTVAVFSPVGGSGKTTVALAAASQLVGQGKTVLFVSTEQLDSSSCVNKKEEDGIVALVEAAADEHVNFELTIKGMIKQGLNGMYYIEGFERFADYDAITVGEIESVLNRIRRCGICDVLVVDMESNLNPMGRAIIELSDWVMIVEKAGELPLVKMELFAQQAFVNEYKNKMVRIFNFAENNSKYSTNLDIPVAGTVHNYGNLQLKDVIHAINKNREIVLDKIIKR